MTKPLLPSFAKPPVVEVVIGVQFTALPNYSNALAGWYWKTFLEPSWSVANEVPRLDDAFEVFDDAGRWSAKPQLIVSQAPRPERLHIANPETGRLIQVQDTRFLLNWRIGANDQTYPTYRVLVNEFCAHLDNFRRFVKESGNAPLELNQWEVTYLNHIPKGDLWQSVSDWPQLLPFLKTPGEGARDQFLESFRGEWALTLPNKEGRLHIALQHARTSTAPMQEIIFLQLMARGPMITQVIHEDLEKGHCAVVKSFAEITSKEAHKNWGRIR